MYGTHERYRPRERERRRSDRHATASWLRPAVPAALSTLASMAHMTSIPTAPLVATGLVGGYAAARHAGRSDLATVVFAGAGLVCARSWLRSSGGRVAGVLLGTYLVAFWISHPLSRKIGGGPSVLSVTAAATTGLADRRRVDTGA